MLKRVNPNAEDREAASRSQFRFLGGQLFVELLISYTHTTQAEHRADRSSAEARGGQNTRGRIEGEEHGRFFSRTKDPFLSLVGLSLFSQKQRNKALTLARTQTILYTSN